MNIGFYNEQLYRGGEGLFPLPLDRDDLLDSDPIDNTPDVEVEIADHPVFRELVQGQNPIIRMMHVERFLRPASRLDARREQHACGCWLACGIELRWPSKRVWAKDA